MSRAVGVALVAAALLVVGCQKGETGGAGGDTFTISVPTVSTPLAQGESKTVLVTVDRGSAFDRGVLVKFAAPAGLQVSPEMSVVEPQNKGNIELKITAAADAAPGEHKVTVTAQPEREGAEVQREITVVVSAKQ